MNPAIFFVIVLAVAITAAIVLSELAQRASSEDFDPCFVDNDMFQNECNKQKIEETTDLLLQRAKEWNQKPYNETLCELEFQCYACGPLDKDACILQYEYCTGNMTKMDKDFCNELGRH